MRVRYSANVSRYKADILTSITTTRGEETKNINKQIFRNRLIVSTNYHSLLYACIVYSTTVYCGYAQYKIFLGDLPILNISV